MPRVCQLTGKRTRSGNKVSHSNIKNSRKFKPNIQKKRVYHPKTGKWVKMNISTRALRTLQKKGSFG